VKAIRQIFKRSLLLAVLSLTLGAYFSHRLRDNFGRLSKLLLLLGHNNQAFTVQLPTKWDCPRMATRRPRCDLRVASGHQIAIGGDPVGFAIEGGDEQGMAGRFLRTHCGACGGERPGAGRKSVNAVTVGGPVDNVVHRAFQLKVDEWITLSTTP
jgi:hypothetical protein